MIRKVHIVFLVLCMAMAVRAQVVQEIPLYPYAEGLYFAPAQTQDDPGRSTPDPTDPTQFRATLTGNTLSVENHTFYGVNVLVTELYEDRLVANLQCGTSCSVVLRDPGAYSVLIACNDVYFIGHFSIYEPLQAPDRWYYYGAAPSLYYTISVYDFYGRQWSVPVEYNGVDLSSLPQGIYLICVRTNKNIQTYKIMKR